MGINYLLIFQTRGSLSRSYRKLRQQNTQKLKEVSCVKTMRYIFKNGLVYDKENAIASESSLAFEAV